MRVWTVPNLFTFARLLAVPVFAALHAMGRPGAALLVYVFAGLSDGIDGLLARLLDQRSRLGALLDPVADKLLLTTGLVMLGVTRDLPLWLVLVVLGREAVLVVGAVAVRLRGWAVPAQPARLGKYAVFCQLVTVVLGLVIRTGRAPEVLVPMLLVAAILAAECTLLSAVQYAVQFGRMLTDRPKA